MDKVSLDDIVNQNELPLINSLECPIDSMVPLNPMMCKTCETIFCPDCIESWMKRSKVCPMRCNPLEVITIDRHVLKNQVNKIKLGCPYHDSGCLAQLSVNEVARHERICDYRPSKCDKCKEVVSFTLMNSHFYESCKMNKIICFICTQTFNLNSLSAHLISCSSNASLCECCAQKVLSDQATHNINCPLQIFQCKLCKLPELNFEIKNGTHKCISDLKENSLTTYLKCLHSKYESSVNNAINKKDELFMDFNKKINDLAAEVFKRENDRSSAVEIKYAKVCDEQAKKLAIIKRDKLEHMKKLKTEIVEWNAHILSKNRL
jgi:hypothetical protein